MKSGTSRDAIAESHIARRSTASVIKHPLLVQTFATVIIAITRKKTS